VTLLELASPAVESKPMDELLLCRNLAESYKSIESTNQADKAYDIHVERLSYLVLVAGRRSRGSRCLDEIFTKIQKESPTLVVPRFVMTPAELEKFLDAVADDGEDDQTYAAYRRKARTISELIMDAKQAITERSGFKFDPSVQVIRAQ
jgi:hypothetical protein